ncbi:MAG: AIM24 family protein, partial [Coriobacteriales bacterium]|nr:AIM24 family protein [Coriobacteriales bacterium]
MAGERLGHLVEAVAEDGAVLDARTVLSGESMFQNIYTAQGGPGMIAFGSSFPGKIVPIHIAPGKEWVLQKRAFLASETGVKFETFFNKKASTGIFGGEGFIMQKLSAPALPLPRLTASLWSTRWSADNTVGADARRRDAAHYEAGD